MESANRVLMVGAVAYDPKVVTIWEGFKAYFEQHGVRIDYLLFSNYESQVGALLNRSIDIAWNSPLAWLQAQALSGHRCRALAMRDTDRDLTTRILVRKHSGIRFLADLKGKRVAVGASDSPQATLIPLSLLWDAGIIAGQDCQVIGHNIMPGKHGDHVGGEREAARLLAAGSADAACVLDSNYNVFLSEGTLDPGTIEVLASTPPYDHCNFTALRELSESLAGSFTHTLLGMSSSDPSARIYMEMEGVHEWLPARTSAYTQLETAVQRFGLPGAHAAAAD